MNSQTILFGLVLIATLVIGWFDSSGILKQAPAPASESATVRSTSTENNSALSSSLNSSSPPPCAMTLPNGSTPPGETLFPNHHHGNGALWALLGRNGVIAISPRDVQPNGTLERKAPWWRGVFGQLRIEGRRLDAPAPPLGAYIPDGYGETGVQAVTLLFPNEGCWEVTGKVGDASLSFVTYVIKVPDCQVTLPNGNTPPGEKAGPDFYGNGKLWTGLWPEGIVLIANENTESDGSLSMKFWWWRATPGALNIEGRRLDATAAPLQAPIPQGYDGPFQASGLSFPTEGCWEVAGKVGHDSLRFVALIVRIHSYPWRAP